MTGVAVVGCGLIGRKRAAALPADAHVVAVHDVAPAAARALADDLADGRGDRPCVAGSVAEAVGTDGVDLVVVATAHDGLADVALLALDAGRHVLVEKPGGRTLADVERVAERARAVGRLVRVGYNHRFHPSVGRLLELTADGAHGRLLHVRGRYGHGGRLGYELEWRADRGRSGGGELLDQGSHLVDLFRVVAGDADLAFAELRTSFWRMEVEDNAFLALRAHDGAFGWLHASWTEWKNLFSLELTYERAKVEITGLGGSYGTEEIKLFAMTPEMGPPPTTAWEWPGTDGSWGAELADVLAALDGRPARGATIDDAVAVHRIIDAAYQGAIAAGGSR